MTNIEYYATELKKAIKTGGFKDTPYLKSIAEYVLAGKDKNEQANRLSGILGLVGFLAHLDIDILVKLVDQAMRSKGMKDKSNGLHGR